MVRCRARRYFGELALLDEAPRSATVEAVGPVTCLRVALVDFVKLLGPIRAELSALSPKRHSKRLSAPPVVVSMAPTDAAASTPTVRKHAPSIAELNVVKPLGAGAFARVDMVRDAATRRLYALKKISKKGLIAERAEFFFFGVSRSSLVFRFPTSRALAGNGRRSSSTRSARSRS